MSPGWFYDVSWWLGQRHDCWGVHCIGMQFCIFALVIVPIVSAAIYFQDWMDS